MNRKRHHTFLWYMLILVICLSGCSLAQHGAIEQAYKLNNQHRYIEALGKLYQAESYDVASPEEKVEILFLRASILDNMTKYAEARGIYKFIADNFPTSSYGYAAKEKLNHEIKKSDSIPIDDKNKISDMDSKVTLEFTIDTNGYARDIVVLSSEPPNIHDKQALDTIMARKFIPKVVNGVPVQQRVKQTIIFVTTQPDQKPL